MSDLNGNEIVQLDSDNKVTLRELFRAVTAIRRTIDTHVVVCRTRNAIFGTVLLAFLGFAGFVFWQVVVEYNARIVKLEAVHPSP